MNRNLIDKYLVYVRTVRRYSERTVEIYADVLEDFRQFAQEGGMSVSEALSHQVIRSYEISLLDSRQLKPRTVNLHLSVLSGFCRYLVREGVLQSNPVKLVVRPKVEKRLPSFYKKEAMEAYFEKTAFYVTEDYLEVLRGSEDSKVEVYENILFRVVITTFYSLGIRRSELINLRLGDIDFGRKVAKIRGKGDKMREIPLVASFCEEILLYLKAVEAMWEGERSLTEPLFVTGKGVKLYPTYVDRIVKQEFSDVRDITGRKSPHVLRHSLATELLNEGADLNSIKELLGHSSLAATQVYTHNSVAKLKSIYQTAHPRAKNGGNYGD